MIVFFLPNITNLVQIRHYKSYSTAKQWIHNHEKVTETLISFLNKHENCSYPVIYLKNYVIFNIIQIYHLHYTKYFYNQPFEHQPHNFKTANIGSSFRWPMRRRGHLTAAIVYLFIYFDWIQTLKKIIFFQIGLY